MRFVYINTDRYAGPFRRMKLDDNAFFVTNNYDVRVKLSKIYKNVFSANDVLSHEDCLDAMKKTSDYILAWLKANAIKDKSAYDVNLYELYSFEFTGVLVDLLYKETAFVKFAKKHNFDCIQVVTQDATEDSLYRYLAGKYGVRYQSAIIKRRGWFERAGCDYFKTACKCLMGFFLVPLANFSVFLKRAMAGQNHSSGRRNLLVCLGVRSAPAVIGALKGKYNICCYYPDIQIKRLRSYASKSIIQIIGKPAVSDISPEHALTRKLVEPQGQGGDCAFEAFNDFVRANLPGYYTFGRRAIDFCGGILKSGKFDAMVVEDDVSRLMKAFVMVANRLGVKVIQISHSTPSAVAPRTMVYPSYSDYMAVGGPKSREVFVEHFGIDSDRIVVTGSPKYDEANPKNKTAIQEFCKKNNIDTNRKVVLVVTPWFRDKGGYRNNFETFDSNKRFFEDLLRFNKAYGSEYYFLVKLHPHDQKQDFVRHLPIGEFKNLRIFQHHDIDMLFEISHVVLSYWSNACLDAVIKDRPLYIVDYTKRPGLYDFMDYGIQKVSDFEGLKRVLLNSDIYPAKPRLEEIKNDYESFRDGNAAGRISSLVDKAVAGAV